MDTPDRPRALENALNGLVQQDEVFRAVVWLAPTQDGLDPQEHFARAELLRDVIIRAAI